MATETDFKRLEEEVRRLRNKIDCGDGPLSPERMRVPSAFSRAPEYREFKFEDDKLQIIAADGTVKTFSPDA